MDMCLDRLEVGLNCAVTEIACHEPDRSRLRQLGLETGRKLRVRYRSPYGGVMVLEFDGHAVALQAKDVKKVYVRPL